MSTTKRGKNWKKAIVSGAEVKRHSLKPETHYIHVDSDILFSGGWAPEHIEIEKILIRRTGDSIIAAVDENGYYHTNALIYGIPVESSDDISLFYLTAILNSKLINYYYRQTTMKEGRTLPQVEVDTLKNLPIVYFSLIREDDNLISPDSSIEEYYRKENYEKIKDLVNNLFLSQEERKKVSSVIEKHRHVYGLVIFLAKNIKKYKSIRQKCLSAFWGDLERNLT